MFTDILAHQHDEALLQGYANITYSIVHKLYFQEHQILIKITVVE